MTDSIIQGPRWTARLDASKKSGDYGDTLRVVAAHYDLYEKGYKFLSPWISRSQSSTITIPPDRATILSVIGKPRQVIHSIVHNSFVDALVQFAIKSKGRRQMISPDPTSHHSAQFPLGTFSIERVNAKTHAISLFGCSEELLVDGLQLHPESIGFIIIRPKIGKLGTASAIRWEVLFFKQQLGYQIDHVDSNLNPRHVGVF